MNYKSYTLKDVHNASSQNKFTVISTFAGGGGSSTGYKLSGGKILAVNEFVESARETYLSNYPSTPILPDNILELTGKDFLKLTNLQSGELDILDGSPPCSAFSISGKREKGWNQEKKYSDNKVQKNIEDLFFEFIRIAKDIQPKVIIGENVKGITFGEARKYFNKIINQFEGIGYTAVGKVLNAADYGVPQARERCFFVAIRNDVLDKTDLNFWSLDSIYPDATYTNYVSLKEAIHNIKNDKDEEQELYDAIENGFLKKWVSLLPKNPKKAAKGSEYHPNQSLFNLVRPCPDLPSPTITQQGQQKGLSGVIHYELDRKLTIPELKRVQGLPDDFNLQGTFNQKAERIGRMVAPQCLSALSKSIYEKVLRKYNEI